MFLVCWIYFLNLEQWPFAEDIPCVPVADFPLITRAVCSCWCPHFGPCGSFPCVGLTAVGGLVGIAGPGPGCQALPGAEATGHWLLGQSHEMAGHGNPGDAWGADGLLVDGPGPAMAGCMTVVVLELVSAH